jgi:hypothetical protein
MAQENTFTQVTPDTLQAVLDSCLRISRPAFIWGNPGIGKSDNVRGLIKRYKKEGKKALLIDVRASQLDAVDTRGVPFTYEVLSTETKTVRRTGWAVPDLFPSEEEAAQYDVIVIFLDELNNAPLSVQAALYQLVLDRQLGAYKLPDNVKILAAGNLETDRGATTRMATPLADRFFHFELLVDGDAWERWALDADMHIAVVAYRRWRPAHLHDWNPRSPSKAQATPRGWEYLSDALKDIEAHGVNGAVETALVCGKIGEAVGAEFLGFLKIYRNLQDPDAVILDPQNASISADPAVNYALCGALAARATEQNIDRIIQYAERLRDDKHAGPEFMTLLVRGAAVKNPSVQSTRGFIKWASSNPEVLIG